MTIQEKTEKLRKEILESVKELKLVSFIEDEVKLMLSYLNYYRLQNIKEYRSVFISIIEEVNTSYNNQLKQSILEDIE